MSSSPIIIVGNGIAGTTLARHIRKKSEIPVLIISEESPYFFSRTALMYVFMGHLKWSHIEPYERDFWRKNSIDLLQARVGSVQPSKKEIVLADGQRLSYNKLILATGSKPCFYNWKGQDLNAVQGFYSKQDLNTLEHWSKDTRRAVVVGGGLIGVELVEMLCSRDIQVHFLVREKSFWGNVLNTAEGSILEDHIRAHRVQLHLETSLIEIQGNRSGRVSHIITNRKEKIACDFVGITTGVEPNISFLSNSNIDQDRGILVDEYLATNQKDVYAIGDCAQLRNPPAHRRAIEAIWYSGRMMGETLAQTLTVTKTAYQPGHWFNSAKFFDIEYQTYGQINPESTSNEKHFFWSKPHKNCAVRLAYHPLSKQFLGLNTFGIRMRHQEIDHWLSDQVTIDYVIQNLSKINFDPEFSKRYETEIQNAWLQQ